MLEANPNLTPAQIASILKSTAGSYGTPVPNDGWGYGEVRAFEAVLAALKVVEDRPCPPRSDKGNGKGPKACTAA